MPKKPIAWIRQRAPYDGMSDCMICTSHKPNNNGYPQIVFNGRNTTLNRVVCQRFNPGMGNLLAIHACDNRLCINPDHIKPGTKADNVADRNNRNRTAKGEHSGHAKLTEEQAVEVYNAAGSLREIGKRFGIHNVSVRDIKRRKNWKHIHDRK